MGKQSGFLQRQLQIQDNIMHASEMLTKQFMLDTLQITLHKDFGWGYERQVKLLEAWKKRRDEYRDALEPKNKEADVAQEHMDTAIRQIIGGRQEFYPFYERYPDLKKIKY